MDSEFYILYVDECEDDCTALTDSLACFQDQIRVIFFNNGQSAIDFLKSSPYIMPRLIILDINKPRMNGKQTFSEIKKLLPLYVPFLFFSTNPTNKDIVDKENKGISIMRKPSTVAGYRNCAITILDLFFADIHLVNKNELRMQNRQTKISTLRN